MATPCAHYTNILKPGSTEYYNVAVFNDNYDEIDQAMYANQVSAAKEMVGASAQSDGESGRVPTPHIADKDKYLKGDGTWDTPSGGGGSSTLAGLSDVTLTSPSNGQALIYDSTNQVWKNGNAGGGGGGSSTFTKLAEYSGAGVGYDEGDTINLSDSLTNYDVLMFSVLYSGTQAFPNAMVTVNDLKNKLTTGFYAGYIGGVGYTDVKYATDTSLTVLRTSSMYVYSVYGIKF